MTPSGGPPYGPPPPPPVAPPMTLGAPPPPPGPGVQPPFVAPPTDGARRRRWIALAWTGAAALVLCVGGLVGIGALVVFGSQMIVDQSTAAVHDYLTAVRDRDYPKAYAMLCAAERHRISERQFESQQREPAGYRQLHRAPAGPHPAGHRGAGDVLYYNSGRQTTLRYQIAQNESTGEFEVCGAGG